MSTGGVAIGDFDGDGLPDIYLVSGPGKNKLYRQVAPMKFEDVTAKAGVDGGDAWGVGDIKGVARLATHLPGFPGQKCLFPSCLANGRYRPK